MHILAKNKTEATERSSPKKPLGRPLKRKVNFEENDLFGQMIQVKKRPVRPAQAKSASNFD
ncbi:hypothetical protein BpHYR1_039243 [Brachionus plicatilis]|uniref:Uncharacterized protein n=1 Tax=Brachionus plicatilis TaxID=10195 RepID=A0A3M7QTV3_BRAPC|nr:hypothetical protein BpHYR1_039243 [Brachionus plicatilis]